MALNIFKNAKLIREHHPNWTWKKCVSEASDALKQKRGDSPQKRKKKKIGAYKVIEKGETKKTPVKKTYRAVRSKTGTFKGMQKITGTDVKAHIKQQLGKACIDYEMATTVKATKDAQKRKLKYRKVLKSL